MDNCKSHQLDKPTLISNVFHYLSLLFVSLIPLPTLLQHNKRVPGEGRGEGGGGGGGGGGEAVKRKRIGGCLGNTSQRTKFKKNNKTNETSLVAELLVIGQLELPSLCWPLH